MYTGTYQPLTRGPSSGSSLQQALKTAFGVYALAEQFYLPELYSLAVGELAHLKTQIDLGSFIEVIRDVHPQTLGKDPWIQSFIAEYIKDAMDKAKTTPPAAEPEADDQDMTIVKLTVKGLLEACGEAMRDVAAKEAALAEAGNAMAPQSLMEDGRASTEAETTAPDNSDWVMASPQPSEQLEAQQDLVEKVKKPKSLKAKKKKKEPLVEPEVEPEAGAALLQEPEPTQDHPISENVQEIPRSFQEEDPEITAIKKEKKAKLKERKAKKKRQALALQAELQQLGQGDMPEQDVEPAPEPEVVQLGPVHVVVEDGPSDSFAKVKKPKKKKKETSVSGEGAAEKIEGEVEIFTPVQDWDR